MTSNHMRYGKAFLASGCAIAALSAMPANAQSANDPMVISEITVTAQKRSESILDVPSAVSVVSPKLLSQVHATQLTDVSAYVPAFQVDSTGTPGQTTISIRGIAPIGRASTVATYIDDAPIGSSSTYGGGNSFQLDLLPYDIERLEILRGPQGTLYGASSMGGLLKYVLSTPSLEKFEFQAGGNLSAVKDAGSPGYGLRAKVSGPIVPGELGFVASYALEDTPGFIDNAVTGEKNQNGVRQQSARLGLHWEPGDHLTVKLNGLYQRTTADGNASMPLDPITFKPLAGDLEDNNLVDQPFKKTIKFISGGIEYQDDAFAVISSTSYSETRTDQTGDNSYSYGVAFPAFGLPVGKSINSYRLFLKKFTQEIRVQSSGDQPLQWLFGGFYTHEDSTNFQSPGASLMDGTPIPGFDPIYAAQLPSTYKEYAGFANLTYRFTQQFEIFGGLRYAKNRQVFSTFAEGPFIDLSFGGPVALANQKSKENVTTYSVGANFKPVEKTMIYVRVSSGYRPGGPNLPLPGVEPTFQSDSLTNYEIGFKSQFADNTILIDAAAFRIDWSDIQLLSNAGFSYVVNGGTARSQGIEANLSVRPVRDLEFTGSFAWIDSTLTEDVPQLAGLDGDRLPNIPKLSGSVGATYSRDLLNDWRGSAGFGLRMVGARLSNVTHASDSGRLAGYAALDLNASLSKGGYILRLYAKNLTDKRAWSSFTPLQNQATGAVTQYNGAIIQPRTIGMAFDVKF